MSAYLKLLKEQRAQAWESGKELLDRATAEKRELTAEEQVAFDKVSETIDALDARATDIAEREQRNADFDALMTDLEERGYRKPEQDAGPDIRDLFSGKASAVDFAVPGDIHARALGSGAGSAGKTIPPSTMVAKLYEELIQDSTVFGVSTLLTTASGEPMDFPRIKAVSDSTNAKVAASSQPVAEAGTIPTVDPVFDKITITPAKYGVLLQIPSELATDTVVDLTGYVAKSAAQGIRNKAGATLTATLIAGAATSSVNAATIAAFTYDNVVDIYHALPVPYRRDASWFVNDSFVKTVRKLKDSQGRPLWEPSLQVGQPDTILGRPVVIDPDVPVSGASAKVAVFGDLSQNLIRQVGQIRFESSVDFAFSTDLTTYRCIWRGGSGVIDSRAMVYATVSA